MLRNHTLLKAVLVVFLEDFTEYNVQVFLKCFTSKYCLALLPSSNSQRYS